MVHRALVLGCVAACSHGWRSNRTPSPRDPVLAATDDRAAFVAADAKLDRITRTTARIGNRVELLIDGTTSFARRLENARDADVILVKTFAFTDDETGRAVADLLIERAKAGAYVVVQYDAIGSIHDPGDVGPMLENGNEKPIISRLRAAGIDVQATNAPVGKVELDQIAGGLGRTLLHPIEHLGIVLDRTHRLEFHDHEKYWITGHHGQLTAIIGGMNIGSEYAFGGADRVDAVTGARGWHDVDVEVAGPVVNDIVARYFAVLDDHRGARADHARWNPPQPAAGNARVRFVFNHPRFHNTHAIDEAYAALVDATPPTGVVRIETAYFAPSDHLLDRMHAALRRGTRLAVISNLETNDTAPVAEGTWFVYHALLDADPSAALYQRIARPDLGEVMIHCKVASFGTRGPVVIGSANLDGQSGEHNSEAVLVIDDPTLRQQFDAMFDQDLAPDRATRVTRDLLEGDSTWTRFRQWAVFNLGKSWL